MSDPILDITAKMMASLYEWKAAELALASGDTNKGIESLHRAAVNRDEVIQMIREARERGEAAKVPK